MSLEHNAILQARRTMLRHAEAHEADQAQLHCTMNQLFHSAMIDACLMACILAGNPSDALLKCRLALQQLRPDCLPLFLQQSQYDYIALLLEELSLSLSSAPILSRF